MIKERISAEPLVNDSEELARQARGQIGWIKNKCTLF